jgi:hypothetical protein
LTQLLKEARDGAPEEEAYGCQGLPLTGRLRGPVVKQVNRRVKGAETLWSEAGGASVRQLRAGPLVEGEPPGGVLATAAGGGPGQRRDCRTA